MSDYLETTIRELEKRNIEKAKEIEVLKEVIRKKDTRLDYLKRQEPKMLRFNQKQKTRWEAMKYAIKVMDGTNDDMVFS